MLQMFEMVKPESYIVYLFKILGYCKYSLPKNDSRVYVRDRLIIFFFLNKIILSFKNEKFESVQKIVQIVIFLKFDCLIFICSLFSFLSRK